MKPSVQPMIVGVDRKDIEQELEDAYEAFSAELLAYASTFVRREDCAVDAVQEVFLRYFVERSYGRVIESPRGWLYRVLRNYLCDRLDRAALKVELTGVDFAHVPDTGRCVETTVERAQAAEKITSQLSTREMQCLRLRAGGATYDEIASTLGIRSGTVSSLLTRVHKKLAGSGEGETASRRETVGALYVLFAGGME